MVAIGDISEVALDKRITREAKNGLTTTDALFVLANKERVSFSREFSKLPPEAQARVNHAISSRNNNFTSVSRSRAKYKKERMVLITLKTHLGEIKEPYLATTTFKEAVSTAEETYPYLYILENSLRNFISLVLERKYGTDWWSTNINGTKVLIAIAGRASDRMQKEIRNSYHGKRGAHAIYYVDFDDLIVIFRSFERDFNPLFKNLGGKLNGMLNKLEEITPSRNVVAHHNPLSKRDNARIVGYLHDWLGQLGYIKTQNLL